MKTKIKKTPKLKEMLLELDGDVFIVERFTDGTVRKEPLDGELVLKSVIHVLEKAIEGYND